MLACCMFIKECCCPEYTGPGGAELAEELEGLKQRAANVA